LTLCEREGPEALTARRLAQETRRSPMALYRHFESMDGLIAAAWGELHRRVNHRVWSAAEQAESPTEAFRILFREFVHFALRHPHLFRFLITAPLRGHHPDVDREQAEGFRRLRDLIQRGVRLGAFRPDLDPRDEAFRALFLMIGSATLMISPRRELVARCRTDVILEATLQEALAGLLPRPVGDPVLS